MNAERRRVCDLEILFVRAGREAEGVAHEEHGVQRRCRGVSAVFDGRLKRRDEIPKKDRLLLAILKRVDADLREFGGGAKVAELLPLDGLRNGALEGDLHAGDVDPADANASVRRM